MSRASLASDRSGSILESALIQGDAVRPVLHRFLEGPEGGVFFSEPGVDRRDLVRTDDSESGNLAL